MGCFLGCFGSSKDRKRRKHRPRHHPRDHERNTNCSSPVQSTAVCLVKEHPEKQIIPVPEVEVNAEEESSSGALRKKVTFDSNVRTYEHVLPEEVAEKDDGGTKEEAERSLVKSEQSQSSSEASSVTSSSGSYPTNHRYQNCRESDDEEEELDYQDSEVDDDEDEDGLLDYDDMSEDDGIVESEVVVDKVGIDDSSMMVSCLAEEVVKPIRGNGAARDRSGYVHSVLNPVENLTQWKALKTKGKPQLKQQKENFGLEEEPPRASFSLEPSFEGLSLSFKSEPDNPSNKSNKEIAVDASLSNWLSSSEATPVNKNNAVSSNFTPQKTMSQGSNSPRSQEDRPILGALTLEEIKQFSASSSPRKSPSRSPDEMPIIGTVGTYWTHTGNTAKDSSGSASSYKGIPNTTSKYREDKRVNWHSTPFETRLERALNRGAAEAFSTQTSNIC